MYCRTRITQLFHDCKQQVAYDIIAFALFENNNRRDDK